MRTMLAIADELCGRARRIHRLSTPMRIPTIAAPHFLLRLAAGLTFALVLWPSPAARAAETLRLQLYWLHQAQFAGYYMAASRGYYEREGLDVSFLESGAGIAPLERLGTNEVDLSIGWLAHALAAREKGFDLINIAQVFQKSGMALACRRTEGINGVDNLPGHTVGVWNLGDEISLRLWLERSGVKPGSVTTVLQAEHGADLINGRLPCVTVMTYNEYWDLIGAGIKPTDLYTVVFADEGLGLLEDGLYARAERLRDPAFRAAVARFLRASAEGWRYAREHPIEALSVTMTYRPGMDPVHQRLMLDSVLNLIPPPGKSGNAFGMLHLDAYERTVKALATDPMNTKSVREVARDAWTTRLWYQAGLGGDAALTVPTRHYLGHATASIWFYLLDLIGTVAFGLAGFMRAQQRRYDLWGAFILTFLPAVGGGTLRDLLIGGDRHPPFIFNDPVYLYLVCAVVVVGTLVSHWLGESWQKGRRFERALAVLDTAGLAAFTVVGAKVALMANLGWFWVPICAALTCAGGGMLLDVVTGREPRTFQGEPYEEIAVAGGLLLYGGLRFANLFEHVDWLATVFIVLTLVVVFVARMTVIDKGLRSFRLGGVDA